MTKRRPTPPRVSPSLDVEGRVEAIARDMAAGTWSRLTAEAHRVTWGVSAETMRADAAEASRRLRSRLNVDELVVSMIGRLERTYEAATADGDHKAAVAAVKVLAEVTGASAPLKVAMTDTKGADVPSAPSMPPWLSEPGPLDFYVAHRWQPSHAMAQQLLKGERDPLGPCGRASCAFCTRFHPQASKVHTDV